MKQKISFFSSLIGAALWGFGLLIHISLVIFTIFFIFENPKFSSDIAKQALKTVEAIKQLENDDWAEVPLGNKTQKADPDKYAAEKIKNNRSKFNVDLSLYYRDTEYSALSSKEIKELLELASLNKENELVAKIYEPILKKDCPDCHLWISQYSLNDASSDYSLVKVKEELQTISKLEEGRLKFWIVVGRLAQVLLTALLLILIFYFWKSKKAGFLFWLEKFLVIISPMLLIFYVAASTTSSFKNYKYSNGMPYFTDSQGEFFLKILIFGFIGIFVLTPVAFTIRKHRKLENT